MKVGFVTVAHDSFEFRPDGAKYIFDYLSTLTSNIACNIYIIDNGSTTNRVNQACDHFANMLHGCNIHYIKIEDQSILGITGAWNLGIFEAFKDKCDIINMTNDDIQFNSTINNYIKIISEHEHKDISLFGPVTNGVLDNGIQKQTRPIDRVVELTGERNVPNGFFFTFTNKFYERFRHTDSELFPFHHEHDGGDGKYGGQEGMFYTWKEQGAKTFIVGHTWIYHHKIRGWKKTRDAYK